ncbi:hypothetical protein GDO86_019478 [Hymenochirus boettgeri]|uniref:Uncharacterized protein n=1 Tax=Hymenochirus boettgeri TaxID=247094 RepID=A0A8T2IGT5_9PIPI|nr:hypothetical protein GDO86_019478 [Hymenochirus boettgeri]
MDWQGVYPSQEHWINVTPLDNVHQVVGSTPCVYDNNVWRVGVTLHVYMVIMCVALALHSMFINCNCRLSSLVHSVMEEIRVGNSYGSNNSDLNIIIKLDTYRPKGKLVLYQNYFLGVQ